MAYAAIRWVTYYLTISELRSVLDMAGDELQLIPKDME